MAREVEGAVCSAHTLLDEAYILLTMPRLPSKQTARSNVAAASPSECFNRAIWYPFLDSLLTSMTDKFSSHQLMARKLVA